MTSKVLFTRESFIQAMCREKQRKKEWEERMNNKLDQMLFLLRGHFVMSNNIYVGKLLW